MRLNACVVTYLESAFLVLIRLGTCDLIPIFTFRRFCSLGTAQWGRVSQLLKCLITILHQSLTSDFLFPSHSFLFRRPSVVVHMSTCGCRSRGWQSIVAFVSPYISSPQSIESSTPGLPSPNSAIVLFWASLTTTETRSGSSLCSHATTAEACCSHALIIHLLFGAHCRSPSVRSVSAPPPKILYQTTESYFHLPQRRPMILWAPWSSQPPLFASWGKPV